MFSWVPGACARLLAPAPTVRELAAWLGAEYDDDARLFVTRPSAIDADHVLVLAASGEPTSLTAGYAAGTGPLIAEAEQALGRARELPRGPGGPFQLAFPRHSSPAASCFVVATTYDPPATAGRRLVELTLRRDPPT